MPLELVVDSLESVPAPLHGEYTEKDGKFHLNVNGLPDVSIHQKEIEKLRKENGERRTTAKALEEKVKRWDSIGKSTEEIQEMLDAAEGTKQEALKKSGNADAIIADLKDKAAKELQKREQLWAAEKLGLADELNLARASERKAIISTSITGALTKAKATTEGLELLTDRLGSRVTFETVDGERVIQVMQADGRTPMAGKGQGGVATFDDLVAEASEKYPSLFEGSGAGGGGKSARDSNAEMNSKKIMKRSEFDALRVEEQGLRIRQKWSVVD